MPPLIGSGRKIVISLCFLFIFPLFNCIFHNEVLCYICLPLKSMNHSFFFMWSCALVFLISSLTHTDDVHVCTTPRRVHPLPGCLPRLCPVAQQQSTIKTALVIKYLKYFRNKLKRTYCKSGCQLVSWVAGKITWPVLNDVIIRLCAQTRASSSTYFMNENPRRSLKVTGWIGICKPVEREYKPRIKRSRFHLSPITFSNYVAALPRVKLGILHLRANFNCSARFCFPVCKKNKTREFRVYCDELFLLCCTSIVCFYWKPCLWTTVLPQDNTEIFQLNLFCMKQFIWRALLPYSRHIRWTITCSSSGWKAKHT